MDDPCVKYIKEWNREAILQWRGFWLPNFIQLSIPCVCCMTITEIGLATVPGLGCVLMHRIVGGDLLSGERRMTVSAWVRYAKEGAVMPREALGIVTRLSKRTQAQFEVSVMMIAVSILAS
jgi:hypothetical protein